MLKWCFTQIHYLDKSVEVHDIYWPKKEMSDFCVNFICFKEYPKHVSDMYRFVNHLSMICDKNCNNVAPTDFGSWSELQSDAIPASDAK